MNVFQIALLVAVAVLTMNMGNAEAREPVTAGKRTASKASEPGLDPVVTRYEVNVVFAWWTDAEEELSVPVYSGYSRTEAREAYQWTLGVVSNPQECEWVFGIRSIFFSDVDVIVTELD